MGTLNDLGIRLIVFLQSLGPWLVYPMKIITLLGEQIFFLLVAPAILWCLDAGLGLRLGILLMFSANLNDILKISFHLPRPYWYSPQVQAFGKETGFGLPSGHSQNTVAIFGRLAAWIRKRWAWAVAILLMVLVGISRLVLGMHFPADVIVGWVTGAILLGLFLWLEAPVLAWISHRNTSQKILAVFAVSLLLILITVLVRASLGAWVVSPEWLANAGQAMNGDQDIAPLALAGTIETAGALFGLACGAILFGTFDARGVWWKRLLRYLVGLVGVLVLWYGLDKVFPHNEDLISYVLYFVRYGLVGLWITAGAPWTFIRLNLARRQPVVEQVLIARAAKQS